MPSWLGFTMTFRRPKPQPRHGALEKSVVWGTGPAPLRLGSWPHVLSSGVRVLPRFLFKAWVLALGVVGGTGPAPLRLGSWPHAEAIRNQEAFKKHSRNQSRNQSRCIQEAFRQFESSLSGINQYWNQLGTFTVLIKNGIKGNQAATPGPLTECRSDTHLDSLSRRSS